MDQEDCVPRDNRGSIRSSMNGWSSWSKMVRLQMLNPNFWNMAGLTSGLRSRDAQRFEQSPPLFDSINGTTTLGDEMLLFGEKNLHVLGG